MLPVGADEWVALALILALGLDTRSMMSTYRKNDCQKEEKKEIKKKSNNARGDTAEAGRSKLEDGRHTGYELVRRVNRVTSVANSKWAQKNVTQISNALWEGLERERGPERGRGRSLCPQTCRRPVVCGWLSARLCLYCVSSVSLSLFSGSLGLWCCRRPCLAWLWNTFITSVSAQNRMHVIRADWRADKRWAFVLIVRLSVSFPPALCHTISHTVSLPLSLFLSGILTDWNWLLSPHTHIVCSEARLKFYKWHSAKK